MTTRHCPRCLQFTSPLRPHSCPCDDFARRARHRYVTALALSLFVGGFGLLYVGTQIPDMPLPAPRTVSDAVPGQSGAPQGSERPATARPDETLRQRVSGGRLPAEHPRQPPRSAASVTPGGGAPQASEGGDPLAGFPFDALTTTPSVVPLEAADTTAQPETATPSPALPSTDAVPAVLLAGGTTRQGVIAYAEPRFGPRYLATPEPRGTWIVICGVRACTEPVQTTDAGPALFMQRRGRIADVSSVVFEAICGELRFGLCPGSYSVIAGPRVTPPATDLEGTE